MLAMDRRPRTVIDGGKFAFVTKEIGPYQQGPGLAGILKIEVTVTLR